LFFLSFNFLPDLREQYPREQDFKVTRNFSRRLIRCNDSLAPLATSICIREAGQLRSFLADLNKNSNLCEGPANSLNSRSEIEFCEQIHHDGASTEMLAPRISLKQLLLSMIVVSFCLAITAMAFQGNTVAMGLTVSICFLLMTIPVYAVLYLLLTTASRLSFARLRRSNGDSCRVAKNKQEVK